MQCTWNSACHISESVWRQRAIERCICTCTVYLQSTVPITALSNHLCYFLQINTIAAIRHSATEGHTVVMIQTDAIHESFYDLFNRRFHRIDASTGPCYYTNISIGAHIKPCRVHPNFECVVVVKKSDLPSIPAPFLNRFEKYTLSHELVLKATLTKLPPALNKIIEVAQKKVREIKST